MWLAALRWKLSEKTTVISTAGFFLPRMLYCAYCFMDTLPNLVDGFTRPDDDVTTPPRLAAPFEGLSTSRACLLVFGVASSLDTLLSESALPRLRAIGMPCFFCSRRIRSFS